MKQLLKNANVIVGLLEGTDKRIFESMIANDKNIRDPLSIGQAIGNIVLRLEKQIATENNKKKGLSNYNTLANRIVRTSGRDYLKGVFNTEIGQFITDGFRLVKFPEPIDYKEASGDMDIESLYEGFVEKCTLEIDEILRSDVQTFVDLEKARVDYTGMIKFEVLINDKHRIIVNAKYLVEILKSMKDPKFYIDEYKKLSPLYMVDSNGLEAILLGLRS